MVVGGVHGCRGCAWLQGAYMVVGGMHGCWGACMVAGGMHGCGGCMVARGDAWLQGGMHGCRGHAWLPGGAWLPGCVGYDKIRSMRLRYASYWNAFLFTDWFDKTLQKAT